MRKFLALMADSGSIGFGFRLLHLSLFTFLYVSAAVLIAMQPAQVLDTFFVREAAAQLRTDPLCACVLRLLGGFSAFAGVQAYLLRDRVLADQEVARPFYGAMLILVLSTLAVARRAVADGVAAPGLSASAAASAAVFGGGALLALVFPPAAPVIDDSAFRARIFPTFDARSAMSTASMKTISRTTATKPFRSCGPSSSYSCA